MAAPTRVQTSGWVSPNGSSASTQTATLTVTSGNTLIVDILDLTGGARTFATTDDKSNSYSSTANSYDADSGNSSCRVQMDYAEGCASGSTTITVTLSGAASGNFWICVTEVTATSGVNAAPAGYEDAGSNSHLSTATSTAMGTDTYIHSFGRNTAWANFCNAGTGFTKVDDQDPVGDGSWMFLAQDQSGSGAVSTDGAWSSDNSRTAYSMMVSFNSGGGSPPPAVNSQLLTLGVG